MFENKTLIDIVFTLGDLDKNISFTKLTVGQRIMHPVFVFNTSVQMVGVSLLLNITGQENDLQNELEL